MDEHYLTQPSTHISLSFLFSFSLLFVLCVNKNERINTQILSASLSCSSNKIGAPRRLGRFKQLICFTIVTVFVVGGVLLFHSHVLPFEIPKMLPGIREYLEGTDLIFGPQGGDVEDTQKNTTSTTTSSSSEMNEIDRDMCSFLFLIYATMLATTGCLSA